MPSARLHPILYVADPYAERDFYLRLGFETVYEGPEFPGFLAVARGGEPVGLSTAKAAQPLDYACLRWQFEVDDVDQLIASCEQAGLAYDLVVEEGGDTHRARIAKVVSPNGVTVWFEGPNEATTDVRDAG